MGDYNLYVYFQDRIWVKTKTELPRRVLYSVLLGAVHSGINIGLVAILRRKEKKNALPTD